jgi:hypothetical protein
VADATLIAHTLSSSSSSLQRLAAVLFGFLSVEEALLEQKPDKQNISSSSSGGKGLLACRLRVKALHQLLQQGMIQLQVVSTHSAAQHQQQQQQVLQGDATMTDAAAAAAAAQGPQEAATEAAAAVYTPAAGGTKKKGTGSKRRRSSAAAATAAAFTAAAAMQCSGWVQLAVRLLPSFFFEPSCSSSSSSNRMCQLSSSEAAAAARVWSLQETEAEALNPAGAGDAAKAVNCLVDMLLEGSLLQQQQQAGSSSEVHGEHQAADCELENEDEELQRIIHQHKLHQQQQQQELPAQADPSSSSIAVTAAASAAAAAAERFEPQYELLSCPDTAAAAVSDVRQSLFDWVHPAAWKLQAQQPPGLQCSMFRYQLRALAWMKWREQHGTEALGFSSSSSSRGDSGDAAAVGEAQFILGSQLLNPLWEDVQLTIGGATNPHPAAGAAGDSMCMCGGCGRADAASKQQQQQCANKQQQQQQRMVLYRAVSHGLVSRVRPAGFCGPAGGVLCDEMGLGKTVEVRPAAELLLECCFCCC